MKCNSGPSLYWTHNANLAIKKALQSISFQKLWYDIKKNKKIRKTAFLQLLLNKWLFLTTLSYAFNIYNVLWQYVNQTVFQSVTSVWWTLLQTNLLKLASCNRQQIIGGKMENFY